MESCVTVVEGWRKSYSEKNESYPFLGLLEGFYYDGITGSPTNELVRFREVLNRINRKQTVKREVVDRLLPKCDMIQTRDVKKLMCTSKGPNQIVIRRVENASTVTQCVCVEEKWWTKNKLLLNSDSAESTIRLKVPLTSFSEELLMSQEYRLNLTLSDLLTNTYVNVTDNSYFSYYTLQEYAGCETPRSSPAECVFKR